MIAACYHKCLMTLQLLDVENLQKRDMTLTNKACINFDSSSKRREMQPNTSVSLVKKLE